MGLQLIFVVETDKKCKSDWIYIKSVLDYYYTYGAHLKLYPVYMAGRGNYKEKESEVKTMISKYKATSDTNETKVIYCFDCDKYDTNQVDRDFLLNSQEFCKENEYDYIWFCRDIERVFLGRKISDNQKKKEAAKYKAKNLVTKVDRARLSQTALGENRSNILTVLDKFAPWLERKRLY